MSSNIRLRSVLIGVFVILVPDSCTKAAILSPRQTKSNNVFGSSTFSAFEPFINPTLATVSAASGTAAATDKTTGTSTTASTSSATPFPLGGVSDDGDNPSEYLGGGGGSNDANNPNQSSNAHPKCEGREAAAKVTNNGPFCEPNDFAPVWIGRTYSATWDPHLFNETDVVTILLEYANPPDGADLEPIWHKHVQNAVGEVSIEMEPEWLQGETAANLSLRLEYEDIAGRQTAHGPTITLTEPYSDSPSATPTAEAATKHTSSSKLGVEVGIPIGLIFLAALCIGVFLGLRRRKQGYLGRRSRSQRLKGHGAVQYTGDDFRSTSTRSRQDSFKDEPVQGGVELQSRVGHRREDSLGESLISPVSPISPVRTSNVFRDEISRQRAGG